MVALGSAKDGGVYIFYMPEVWFLTYGQNRGARADVNCKRLDARK